MGGGSMLAEVSPSSVEGGPVAIAKSAAEEGGVSDKLEGKAGPERAEIKAREIAKRVSPGVYEAATNGLAIEVVEINSLGHGVEVFARVRKDGEQIGFGPDGTVDIERFRIFNPPILVLDPSGPIHQAWVDREGHEWSRDLREDPTDALIQSLAHTISVKEENFGPEDIIEGKVGNTTSTFYPQAGSGGGNTTFDGYYNWGTASAGVSFSSARDQSGSSGSMGRRRHRHLRECRLLSLRRQRQQH